MDDRKKDQSIQSHANFDGDSATGDQASPNVPWTSMPYRTFCLTVWTRH